MNLKFNVAFLVAAFAAATARADMLDYIRAIVGNSVITGQQISRVVADEIQQRASPTSDAAAETLWNQYYTNLLQERVVIQDFNKLEKDKHATIPDSYVDSKVEQRIQERFSGDRVRFDKWLQANGMTRQDFRNQIRDEIIVQSMRSEFIKEPLVSPHKVELYYEEHQDKYLVPETIKFRWIAMDKPPGETNGATRKVMENVLSLAQKGSDFNDLAATYSQRPQRDSDWLETDKVNDDYRAQLDKIKPGDCTDIIETSDSFFILHLDARQAKHVTPLSDVRDDIANRLKAEELNRRFDAWINKLRAKILVEEF